MKAIHSIQASISTEKVNPICWTGDPVRIMHLETISTMNHPSRTVEAEKTKGIIGAAVQLLQAGVSRRQTLVVKERISDFEAQVEVEEMKPMV